MRYLLLLLFYVPVTFALPVSMSMGAINLVDALRLVADQAHMNVMISPEINGLTTLHMSNVSPEHLFESLLTANHLGRIKIGSIWYVAPHDSLMKSMQEKRQQMLEDGGVLQTQSWMMKYARAEDVVKVIHAQLYSDGVSGAPGSGQVSFDGRTNMVIMRDTGKRIAAAARLVRKLDIPVQQVLIETRLASVDVDAETQLGIEFATHMQQNQNNVSSPLPVEPGRIVFSIGKLSENSQLDIALSALEQNGKAELISSPSLLAGSQQEASIEAGEEVPYQEVSRSGGTAVAFKKAVLGLKVTPQVLPDNRILLQLQINQDRPASRMIGGVPAISTRQIKTSALLKSGETVVLGGIYEVNQEKNRTSVPFLGNIPVIGLLFTHNIVRKNKRELLIFVTPRIKII